jgi:hypothetical protein
LAIDAAAGAGCEPEAVGSAVAVGSGFEAVRFESAGRAGLRQDALKRAITTKPMSNGLVFLKILASRFSVFRLPDRDPLVRSRHPDSRIEGMNLPQTRTRAQSPVERMV